MVVEDIQRYGGLTIFPFLLVTPLSCEASFYDYRSRSGTSDDILYVIKKSGERQIISRVRLIIMGLIYLITEPMRLLKKLILKK